MSKYVIKNGILIEVRNDALTHGNTASKKRISYIDLDADEIAHFKYIKREKLPNGKYRYYYQDDAYEKAKKKLEDAQSEEALARQNVESSSTQMQKILAESQYIEASMRAATAKDAFKKAEARYNLSAGYQVSSLLNAASDVIDKAKSWVSGLFGAKKKTTSKKWGR